MSNSPNTTPPAQKYSSKTVLAYQQAYPVPAHENRARTSPSGGLSLSGGRDENKMSAANPANRFHSNLGTSAI